MSSHFLTRRRYPGSSHRSTLVIAAEKTVFVTYMTLTTFTLQTSLDLNKALTKQTSSLVNHTLILPQFSTSNRCNANFRFPNNQESYLRLAYKDWYPAGDNVIRCVVHLAVPRRKFISLKFSPYEMSATCTDPIATFYPIHIYDAIHIRPCEDDFYITQRATSRNIHPLNRVVTYHSEKNSIYFVVNLRKTTTPFAVNVTIRALNKNQKRHLYVSHETYTSGNINLYGFDGVTDYAMAMNIKDCFYPPPGHSVMISLPHLDIVTSYWCFMDSLSLYVNRKWSWDHCGHYQLYPQVYKGILEFRFRSSKQGHSKAHTGFRIKFSFHSALEVPDKLLTTRLNIAIFNCSVSFFAKFKQHLDCNLDTECAHSEDEARCPYNRGACEPGFLNAGSKCYKYIKLGYQLMTWYDASAVCLKKRLTLVSFSTLNEEGKFRENILRFAYTANPFFIGLRTSDRALPDMYREVWKWSSGIMAYHARMDNDRFFKPACAALNKLSNDSLLIQSCGASLSMQYIFCEAGTRLMFNKSGKISLTAVENGTTFGKKRSTRFVSCSGQEMHDFLSCDHMSHCEAELGMTSCVTYGSGKSNIPETRIEVLMFVCDSQTQTIHYTQVCDHHRNCFDSSDESFCIHQTCSEKQCQNGQCITAAQWCDGMAHCPDGSDETCPQFVVGSDKQSRPLTPGFRAVFFDGHGMFKYVHQDNELSACPPTHFLCVNRELCLPVYLRCNGVHDCSDKEDENNCDAVTCPGYYRCLGSAVCVHSDHVCDGVFQCPEQDDELLCDLVCPNSCLCQGLAFVCPRPFPVHSVSELRFLDASGSGLTPDRLVHNHYLVKLSLSNCSLQTLPAFVFPNMKFLDLSNNMLTMIDMYVFLKLPSLNCLNLSGNPIVNFTSVKENAHWDNFHSLDLSHTSVKYLEIDTLWNIQNLKSLNLSHSMLTTISSTGFESLPLIQSLDLRGTNLREYPVKMLHSLSSLRVVFTDIYKLCCEGVLPDHFNNQNCHTSPDQITSCKDLLRSEIYRMFLWASCCFSLVGNAGSFAAKIYMQRGKPSNSFTLFISNLNVADFLMGLYLAVIGSADQVYRGTYLWHDESWKTSAGCQIAGFFSLLSCEMSAFMICFITLDRFLVMRFPFSQLHFRKRSTGVVCVLSWMVGVVLAAIPLLPITSDWNFYNQTGICIPLPITRNKFKGHFYSFGILIVFNFLLFVIIAVGQLFIYTSIRGNSMATDNKNEREATVARRLLTVVISDFLCWFPIGLLGLMASNDIPIPGEVNVAMAVFVLPLNSALNPFLYTFNLLMEKRRKASEQRLMKLLQSRIVGQCMTK